MPLLSSAAPWLLALATLPPQDREPVSEVEIHAAIEKGAAWLLEQQDDDGAWHFRSVAMPGATALCLYALLYSGVERDDSAVGRALLQLASVKIERTYDVALSILALAALDPIEHMDWIEDLAQFLVSTQNPDGDWGYPGSADLSNTQYAALGLRTAMLAGVDVPGEVWTRLMSRVLSYGKRDGAFVYNSGGNGGTASMTAAGVGTLALASAMLARGGTPWTRPRATVESAIAAGEQWLARDFEDAIRPTVGAWGYYRIYGIERLAAFLGRARIGEHDWYAEGSAELVALQAADGSWGRPATWDAELTVVGSGFEEVETAFALLFLRKATHASTTGSASSEARAPSVFGTQSPSAAVQVRATGQDPLTVWITGFGAEALAGLEWPGERGRGPRVERVEYLVDGLVVAQVEGQPSKPAGIERFAARHRFAAPGVFELRARVRVRAPGDTASTAIESPAFAVEIREVVPAWVREQQGDRARNLVPAADVKASASSELGAGSPLGGMASPAAFAADNRGLTCWLADPEDRAPELTLVLSPPQRADLILISAPRSVPHRPGFYSRPITVEVEIDGQERFRVAMPPDELLKGRLVLERPQRIGKLELRILATVPGVGHASTGLAEVELQLR